MQKLLAILIFLFVKQVLVAQTKTYKGAWFDVSYPANFVAQGSLESLSAEGYESAVFKSPDNLVEFYIFSPQWSGEAPDIELKSTEKLASSKARMNGDVEVRWWTISAKDGSYQRSYQESTNESLNTNWIVGITYKNSAALKKYRKEYSAFKKSLIQYAD